MIQLEAEISNLDRKSLRLAKTFCASARCKFPSFTIVPGNVEQEEANAKAILDALGHAQVPKRDRKRIAKVLTAVSCACTTIREAMVMGGKDAIIEKIESMGIRVTESQIPERRDNAR